MFAYAELEQKKISKDTVQKKETKNAVSSPNLTGIPDGMKSQFENFSGFSFDDVRVYYNSDKPKQLQALAYTKGNQVYIAPGQTRHLEHELGHVVQQKQNRVRATGSIGGMAVNDDSRLEREADSICNTMQFKKGNYTPDNIIQKKDEPVSQKSPPSKPVGLKEMLTMIKEIAQKGEQAKISEASAVLSLISDCESILNSGDDKTAGFLEKALLDGLEKADIDIPSLSQLEATKSGDEGVIQGFWLEALWCVVGMPIAAVVGLLLSPLLLLKHIIGYGLRDLPRPLNNPLPQVPDAHKAGFTAILRTMPFVANLYVQANMALPLPGAAPLAPAAWMGGGNLQDNANINQVDDGNTITRDDSEITNGRFVIRLTAADRFIKQAMDAAVLMHINKPRINVHLRNKAAVYRPWGFRPYYDNQVHVAQDENVDKIVHEVGHHIEASYPGHRIATIDVLLRSRNGDNPTAKYIYPWSFSEQRYSGDYPATGIYTSKHYRGGSTEVLSVSLEYLSNPQKFMELIEQDPQQAAIILRIINPAQFAALVLNPPGGHNFAQYIP